VSNEHPPYHSSLPDWPTFAFGDPKIDGLIPACKVTDWNGFQNALASDFFYRPGVELVYRGHRRHEWPLTPTLGRFTDSGVIQAALAQRQLDEFRYAMRGRGASFSQTEDENELWAYGQHHGLATPLLDWTESPYVALFFAFADADPEHEQPNASRPIFILNETALAALDEALFVQPMRNDHTRLINQAGLFTISPLGEKTLLTHIMDLLIEARINTDDPATVAEYICKIHVPNSPEARNTCLRALRMMNIHHGTLFPDAIGASLYCNNWVGSLSVVEKPSVEHELATPTRRILATNPDQPVASSSHVAAMLKKLNPPEAEFSDLQITELAEAISQTFDEYAGPDWSRRANNIADLRVRFRKLIKLHGWQDKNLTGEVLALFQELSFRASQDVEAAT
jgi:hypothetical protein